LSTFDPTKTPNAAGARVLNTTAFDYPENEFHVMTTSDEDGFPSGNYTWYLTFSGSLLDGILGFYRSSYKTSSGEERY
jgi:hypothetical protein